MSVIKTALEHIQEKCDLHTFLVVLLFPPLPPMFNSMPRNTQMKLLKPGKKNASICDCNFVYKM